MPKYYRRYVDDILTIMPDITSAVNFLEILYLCHSSIKFTMETESKSILPFLSTQLLNKHSCVETKVYIKPTNTGLPLHYKSHVVEQYKNRLLCLIITCISTFIELVLLLWRMWFTEIIVFRTKISWQTCQLFFSHVLLPPKHLINLFPHQLSAIEQTPFVLSYHLKIRSQLILYASNLKI